MKQVVTRGIVLARTDFGEADRILTILTSDQGKIRAIAKGVRKVKSKLAGGIELFSISQISYILGKSDIYTLTSTRLEKHYSHITKDLDRTLFGYDTLKLLNKSVEDNVDGEYFDLLQNVFEALNDQELSLGTIKLWLNSQLLKLSGHSPNLKTDLNNDQLQEDKVYNFNIEKMSFVAKPQGRYNSQHIKLLRLAFGVSTPLQLKKLVDKSNVTPDCLHLTKAMISQF